MVKLRELINVSVLQGLMENFCGLVNVAMAIVDTEGKVLVSAGFQDICNKYHRQHPQTAQNCMESDLYLSGFVKEGVLNPYKCKNGLWDMATPIVIDGQKLGNLFIGQFFFEDEQVDESLFMAQAKKFGFDEKEYLESLRRVPRWNKENLTHAMNFASMLAKYIADMSYSSLELKASEARYKSIFFGNHSVMLLINPKDGAIFDANPAACSFYGWSHEEIVRLKIDQINTLSMSMITEKMKMATQRLNNSFEFVHRKANGELCDVEVYSGPINVDGNELLYSIVHDVSARNRAIKELEKSRESLKFAQRIGKLGSWEWNILTGELNCSDEIYNIFGLQPGENISTSDMFFEYVHPSDREHYLLSISNCVEKKIAQPFEYRIIRPDGKVRNIFADGQFVKNEKGEIVRGVGIVQDVTERITAERRLFESEFKFKSIVETSPNAILITNLTGIIEYVNDQALDILGYNSSLDLLEDSIFDLVHEDSIAQAHLHVEELLKGSFSGPIVMVFKRKDTSCFFSEINAALLKDSDNLPLRLLFIAKDITLQLNYQEALKRKNDELEEALLEKDRFFSIIAHDLKSPFNGFLGLTHLMAEKISVLSPDQIGKMADVLKNSAGNLYQLLDNLLEWSRAKQGLVKANLMPADIVFMTKEVVAIHLTQAKNKSIDLVLNLPDESFAMADAHMFKTIIRNIISNAIKFTPAGGKIEISIDMSASYEESLSLSVKDTGLGIPEENIADLFSLNSQFRRKGTEQEPSTGLGLILCKEFAEKQGGSISVTSQVGTGSTFTLTLKKAKMPESR